MVNMHRYGLRISERFYKLLTHLKIGRKSDKSDNLTFVFSFVNPESIWSFFSFSHSCFFAVYILSSLILVLQNRLSLRKSFSLHTSSISAYQKVANVAFANFLLLLFSRFIFFSMFLCPVSQHIFLAFIYKAWSRFSLHVIHAPLSKQNN